MSLLEPSKKLDKGQLLWDLLSQFVSPAVEAMKEVRMSMMAKLLALQKKKAQRKNASLALQVCFLQDPIYRGHKLSHCEGLAEGSDGTEQLSHPQELRVPEPHGKPATLELSFKPHDPEHPHAVTARRIRPLPHRCA